jgi:hypothetical protein
MEKNNNFVKYLLFAMPLFFGVIGFVVIGHTPVLDALFCVMQMYVLNYGGTPANVFVELARWTAPLATMTGVLLAFAQMRSYIRNRITYLKGGSTAVYGPEEEKRQMLVQLGEKGIDGGGGFVKAERYILLNRETDNIRFYQNYAPALAGHMVYMKTGSHCSLAAGNIKPFCSEETAARLFWKQPHIFEQMCQPKACKNIVMIGFGTLGEQLLYWGLMNMIFSPTETIAYYIFGDGEEYRRVHHGLQQISDPVWFYEKPWYEEKGLIEQADLVIVAEQERQNELLGDLLLATTAPCMDVLATTTDLIGLLDGGERLRVFDWQNEAQQIRYVFDEELLYRAKSINLRYSHLYQGTEETRENREREWQALNTFTRYSNISAADYHEIRLMMLKHMGIDPNAQLHGEILELFSHLEHIRWCRYHYLNNWYYGEAVNGKAKDPIRRTHADLVPYEALKDAEKEKDRENIRILMSVKLSDIEG